jgi:hypothetical protein
VTPLDAALSALPANSDPFMRAKLEAMLLGYDALWDGEDIEVVAVEREFQAPFVHPDSTVDPDWLLAGKIDLIARWNGRLIGFDHKSSSENDFTLRARASISTQSTQYFEGAESLGLSLDGFCFDVLFKPSLEPYKATPVEKRKYTAKEGKLYANQREVDETPSEYRGRVAKDIADNGNGYFSRIEVTRLEAERGEFRRTLLNDSILIDTVRAYKLASPNEGSCFAFGRWCDFHDACSGVASIEDPTRFRRKLKMFSELELPVPAGKRLLTHSRRQCFNRCRQLHNFAYERSLEPVKAEADARSFGTALHTSIEAFWRAWPRQQSAVITRKEINGSRSNPESVIEQHHRHDEEAAPAA